MDEVRGRFINKILEEEGARMFSRQTSRISAVLQTRSGRLLNSRGFFVSSAGDNFEGQLSLVHPVYERFLDIKRLKGQEKSHSRKIHNKIVFAAYGRIAERLMSEFTEETRQSIRKEFRLAEKV